MRKRLRKKLRVGEFAEFFCRVTAIHAPDPALMDDMLSMAESRGLAVCGMFAPTKTNVTVDAFNPRGHRRRYLTTADVDHVRAWLRARPSVTEYIVGPLERA